MSHSSVVPASSRCHLPHFSSGPRVTRGRICPAPAKAPRALRLPSALLAPAGTRHVTAQAVLLAVVGPAEMKTSHP